MTELRGGSSEICLSDSAWDLLLIEPFRHGGSLRVEFLPGRLRFIKHGHDKVEPNQRPPFGCCLLIWGAL